MTGLEEARYLIGDIESLVRVVLSGRRRNFTIEHERIDVRPVEIKGELHYQLSYSDGQKVITKNFSTSEFDVDRFLNMGYANITIEHRGGRFTGRFTKKDEFLSSTEKGSFVADTAHDRNKTRALGSHDPFLKAVGIADTEGKIKPSKMDKYKQIDEFLRLVSPEIKKLGDHLTVVDFGSGSGYLTFALHQFFGGEHLSIVGVDQRDEFERKNSDIARQIGAERSATFVTSSIADYPLRKVDVVIALHACDTATDDALAWAVRAGARAIFVAPCCHHDIQRQMKVSPQPWGAVTEHGIMRERLGDLITDALRIEILKSYGYRCDAIEFIGDDHTPRNLMIRAILTGERGESSNYDALTSQWKVESALHRALSTR